MESKQWGSFLGRGKRFSIMSRPASGPTQSPIQWVPGAVSLGVKRLGRDADHSAPSSAEVKNGGVITPLPHTSQLRDAYLIKPRDKFAFT
jgi:hypothetical protein